MEAFFRPEELELSAGFLKDGFVGGEVEDPSALERVRNTVAELAAKHLGMERPKDPDRFLNDFGGAVKFEELNDLRLDVINRINAEPWLRPAYFALARSALETVVGNELAMQRTINLSIQLPGDDSSLLPVHADVWQGDSPFEVVLWLPLVDCFGTKSMFFLPPGPSAEMNKRLKEFKNKSSEDLFQAIEPQLLWLDVPYGHFLLFSQNLLHGNRVNQENAARWSMNCRFKSLFSPYAGKKLGEFFEPIILRSATRIGMTYRLPEGFDD